MGEIKIKSKMCSKEVMRSSQRLIRNKREKGLQMQAVFIWEVIDWQETLKALRRETSVSKSR